MSEKAETKGKHNAAHDEDSSKKTAEKNATESKQSNGDRDFTQEIDSLLSVLEGDLTAVEEEAATNLVNEWYDLLHKSSDPEQKEIATTLKELKQLLKKGKGTGHEIGEVLSEIGEQTTNIASEADKGLKTHLQKLGKQLKKVGTSLGKAEDQEHIERIDSLVETLEGDLSSIDTDVALGAIDEWYTLLHKSESESIKEISNGLKHLKQVLKHKNPKAADIAETLTQLGEQTQEAAKEAGRGLKGPIQRLGKLLSKTGKSLH